MPDAASKPRFFVPAEEEAAGPHFRAGQHLPLPPTEAHHAAHVLRLKAGDAAELFDGRGGSAVARIAPVRRGEVEAIVEEVRPPAPRPDPVIHLGFAVPKGSRLDWLLEKVTELGVASLTPVVFERSIAGGRELSPAKRERWLGRLIAAAKQSGMAFLPEIRDPVALDEYLKAASEALGVYGDLCPHTVPIADALRSRRQGQSIAILVGPEGGLTNAERAACRQAGLVPIRLGATTLRIETAAVALVAATAALTR